MLPEFFRHFILLTAMILHPVVHAETEVCKQAEKSRGPHVLGVVAHPDDEVAFAATVYRITHQLKGRADLIIITNGEGGYKYSTLSEPLYCLELSNENVGRQYLPSIRKMESLNSAKILGVCNCYFLDQEDTGYTLDPEEVLQKTWNAQCIKEFIMKCLMDRKYDFIFTLLPDPQTHGHHKAATLLTLEVVNHLPLEERPVILAADTPNNDAPKSFLGLPNYPLTAMQEEYPIFKFNKLQPLGFQDKLNYQIIVNWVIAAHKSQGAVQLLVNRGEYESFYYFKINGEQKIDQARRFFTSINQKY